VYRFGACNIILHDQGREFNNKTVGDLSDDLKIQVAMYDLVLDIDTDDKKELPALRSALTVVQS